MIQVIALVMPFIIFISFLSLIIWLQVALSKKQSKWPGLVLPILSLVIALSMTAAMTAFYNVKSESQVIENGVVISSEVIHQETATVGDLLPMILMPYIPALVLFVIYIVVRKTKKTEQVEKMTIHDL